MPKGSGKPVRVPSHNRVAARLTGAALASRSPSVDLLRLVAQLPAQDLADIGPRQLGSELHQLRDLVGRKPRLAVGDQARFGEKTNLNF